MFESRRSLHLDGYDYSRPGAYFLTFVLHERRRIFWDIRDGEVRLSAPGRMVRSAWLELPKRYLGVQLDEFAVMPDHFHGIVHLVEAQSCDVGRRLDLFQVVHRFKSYTTAQYRIGVRGLGWPRFRGRLWQRGYYERVVRDHEALDAIRRYIRNNPLRYT
jgi:REP-associated tyrosine transposase